MQHNPDDVTRMVLAILIWTAFLASLATILLRGIPKDATVAITQMTTTVASGAALIVRYYFKRD